MWRWGGDSGHPGERSPLEAWAARSHALHPPFCSMTRLLMGRNSVLLVFVSPALDRVSGKCRLPEKGDWT